MNVPPIIKGIKAKKGKGIIVSDNEWPTNLVGSDVPVVEGSPLEALKSVLAVEVSRPPLVLPVPERPGVSVRFDANVDSRKFLLWQKKGKEKQAGDVHNPLKSAIAAISDQTEAILVNGNVVLDDNDNPVTFRSVELRRLLPDVKEFADDATVIRKFYGVDAHIITVSNQIVDAAGYGQEITPEENPTN